MRSFRLALLVVVGVLIQTGFLAAIRPLGIVPNILIIVIIYAGLICTASETLVMAIVAGLMLDGVSAVDFGLRTAFLSFLALAIIVIKRAGADFENTAMILAATLSATILYNAAVIASFVGSVERLYLPGIVSKLGAEVVINLVLVLLLKAPIVWVLSTTNHWTPFKSQGGKS